MGLCGGYFLLQGFRWPKASAVIVGIKVSDKDPNDGHLLVEFASGNGELVRALLWNDECRFPFPFAWKVGERIEIAYNHVAPDQVTWPHSARLVVVYSAFVFVPFFGWLWHRFY